MSHTGRTIMGPPQDIVMGPPPLPPQLAQSASQKSRESHDVAEKYRRLKRKYFDLEEKHKDTLIQLQGSGERNVKWRSERGLLLDRIAELETNPTINPNAPIPDPPFTAFPRSLMSTHGQKLFVTNLRNAIDEIEREDPDVDPLLLSRHIGPQARKRQEAELKEKLEEEAREARRASRRPRAPQKGKDIGNPLTFAPAQPPPSSVPSPPILVSSTGTRLRLKPPAPPPADPATLAPSSSSAHNPPQHHLPPAQHHQRRRSDSPISPELSPQDEYMPSMTPLGNMSPSYQHAGPPPTQAQMQMTLRASSAVPSRPSDLQRHAKPKRLKAHTVTTKSFSIPTVPRDKRGKPLLPLNVGIMTVINLGEVCMREHFHTERYIFPVGYEVTRRYLSTIDPNAEVVYHCKILDGGDGPKFQIVAADTPDKPVIAGTATGAWSVIVRSANHIRNRQHSNSVSGPDFFGLGQNTIKHLIQELPHANQLKDYVWQHFVEGGPLGGRHAAVIPALPEEHDGSPSAAMSNNVYYAERVEIDQDRPRELQIIHVESDDPGSRRPVLPPPPTMKPLTFHQEYGHPRPQNAPKPERGRRGSRAGNPAYDEYVNPPPPQHADTPPHHRPMSHSPVLHRDHEHYSSPQLAPPHGRAPSRSPYQHHAQPEHNGVDQQGAGGRSYIPAGATPPPVPPTFASIMNAYPAPPMASPPAVDAPQEYMYANGGGRRNGHAPYSPLAER